MRSLWGAWAGSPRIEGHSRPQFSGRELRATAVQAKAAIGPLRRVTPYLDKAVPGFTRWGRNAVGKELALRTTGQELRQDGAHGHFSQVPRKTTRVNPGVGVVFIA